MEIRYAEKDGKLVVAFCGDLDNASVQEAEKMLIPVFKREDCDLLLECSHLNYVSSMGLRLILNLYKHFRNCDHRSYVTKMNENVKEVFDISGFLKLFEEIE